MTLIPTVSSAELTFSFNSNLDLKRPCFNNNTFCSSSAQCNITVIYPDSSVITGVDNVVMTNQGSYHNFTIDKEKVDQLGQYSAIMTCFDGGGDIVGSGSDTFPFQVTGDGNIFSVFPMQLTVLILGFVLIIVGKIKEEFRLLKHLGSILAMIMGVVTIYPGYSFFNYSNIQGMALGFTSVGIGFWFLIEDSFSRGIQSSRYAQEPEDDGRFHGFG